MIVALLIANAFASLFIGAVWSKKVGANLLIKLLFFCLFISNAIAASRQF